MESALGGPTLIEELPDLVESRDIMHICRNGVCRAAMPMEVFEAYMYAGMERVTAWRNKRGRGQVAATVVPFKKA